MTILQFFIIKMHQLFGLHHFELVPHGYGSPQKTRFAFRARCRCGCYLRSGAVR